MIVTHAMHVRHNLSWEPLLNIYEEVERLRFTFYTIDYNRLMKFEDERYGKALLNIWSNSVSLPKQAMKNRSPMFVGKKQPWISIQQPLIKGNQKPRLKQYHPWSLGTNSVNTKQEKMKWASHKNSNWWNNMNCGLGQLHTIISKHLQLFSTSLMSLL
mgnify:CR=1 FL=1